MKFEDHLSRKQQNKKKKTTQFSKNHKICFKNEEINSHFTIYTCISLISKVCLTLNFTTSTYLHSKLILTNRQFKVCVMNKEVSKMTELNKSGWVSLI